ILNMEIASDFIAMAAELMLIKSKMLLPKKEDEEDPRQPLVDALLEHQRAIQAAVFLKKRGEVYYDRFTKEPDESDGIYMRSHAVSLLQEAFLRMSERSEAKPGGSEEKLFVKIEKERYYTVEEKILSVMRKLAKRNYVFEEIFEGCKNRSEIIAVFLAVLETVSKGRVGVVMENKLLYLTLIRKKSEPDKE
ncbi:MAG TPA: hypothetical protein DD733_12150, partial [Clostridiales bacterium]|nr:hypothetical protein [Clostridiales bacterium]